MSGKSSSQKPSSRRGETATAIQANKAGRTGAAPRSAKAVASKKESTPGRIATRISDALGSLKLAIGLLSLFTFVVFLGIIVEHRYGTSIAQDLVYKTWWFNGLLGMLAINVLFAAIKKMRFPDKPPELPPLQTGSIGERLGRAWSAISHYWPWRRHQTGFLVTHLGLITLLSGGVANYFWGVDAMLQLVDSGDPKVQALMQERWHVLLPQARDECFWSDVFEIEVQVRNSEGKLVETIERDITPGALPWRSLPRDPEARPDLFITLLNWLQQPLGRYWWAPLRKGDWLEVVDYIPKAQKEDYVAADEGPEAFKVQLKSPRAPMPLGGWLSPDSRRTLAAGSGIVQTEILAWDVPESLLKAEFLSPPSEKERGSKGVLSVHYGGNRTRIPVAKHLGKTAPAADGSVEVLIREYIPNVNDFFKRQLHGQPPGRDDGIPRDPGIRVIVKVAGVEVGDFLLLARNPSKMIDMRHKRFVSQGELRGLMLWYHEPDIRRGNTGLMGALQFAKSLDGEMFFRTFAHRDGEFKLDNSGPIDYRSRRPHAVFSKMGFTLRIVEYYRHAKEETTYTPVAMSFKDESMDTPEYPSVIRCRLHDSKGQTQEFWVQRESGRASPVKTENGVYHVFFKLKTMKLGFTIHLDRAEQTNDPGTTSAATYSSWVRIFDPERGINGRREHITMNEPLVYRGLTFYQSTMQQLGVTDAKGRPVNLSGFTVARDPGITAKYLGSVMVALGIFIMFYMKAYFFKPRRRKPVVLESETESP